MPTVLITGASRGIGLEFARQYAADGWRVIATCRDPKKAGDLTGLKGKVEVHALDVADWKGIDGLAKTLAGESIDLLINNAGLAGNFGAGLAVDHDQWREVLEVNTMGPLKLCAAFTEHVARSDGKRMVTISSRMGSIAENSSGDALVYRSSKSAVNAVMRSAANSLKSRKIVVVVLSPGWVRTDMGGTNAALAPKVSIGNMRQVIAGLTLADSGRFLGHDGSEVPW